jgi:hypothetical protein
MSARGLEINCRYGLNTSSLTYYKHYIVGSPRDLPYGHGHKSLLSMLCEVRTGERGRVSPSMVSKLLSQYGKYLGQLQ